jgi:hypothetical protein
VFALVWTMALALLGVALFAPLTFLLYDAGHIGIRSGIRHDPDEAAALYASAQFAVAYLWKICKAIPLIEVTATIAWDRPLKSGTRMALLLLTYKGSWLWLRRCAASGLAARAGDGLAPPGLASGLPGRCGAPRPRPRFDDDQGRGVAEGEYRP